MKPPTQSTTAILRREKESESEPKTVLACISIPVVELAAARPTPEPTNYY